MLNPITYAAGLMSLPNWLVYVVLIAIAVYIYGTWTFSFFSSRGIPGPKPWPLIGNMDKIGKEFCVKDAEHIKNYGKVWGMFLARTPLYVVADPEMVKEITIKQFSHFVNRNKADFKFDESMEKGLTMVQDQEWKSLRSVITPTFSSGKLKKMVPLIVECAKQFVSNIDYYVTEDREFEAKDVGGKYAMDITAQAFFGVESKTSVVDGSEENPFVKNAKHMFNLFSMKSPKFLILLLCPKFTKWTGIELFDKSSTHFFRDNILNILKLRRESKNPSIDFLQLLINAHLTAADEKTQILDNISEDDSAKEISSQDQTESASAQIADWKIQKRELTDQEILGNAMIFFLAGYETTATLLGWVMYCLVLNADKQDVLYEEIVHALDKTEGEVTYNMIAEMPYLDQVVNETLRLYTPAGRTDRRCDVACDIGPIHFQRGDIVHLSMYGIHHNEEYWPEPEKFEPERFSPERKANIKPYTFFPFGLGPRNCVGMRMAYLEVKIATVMLLHKFRFVRSENFAIRFAEQHPLRLQRSGSIFDLGSLIFSETHPQSEWPGACVSGHEQTPIDLKTHTAELNCRAGDPFDFADYENTQINALTIIDKLQTIQLEFDTEQTVSVSGGGLYDTYELLQVHFHWSQQNTRGSEHTIDGIAYPMEVHFVNRKRCAAADDASRDLLAVFGVLFQIDYRENNTALPWLEYLKTFSETGEKKITKSISPYWRLSDMLPKDRSRFYRYYGSLTTPGCNEIVLWTVFQDPIPISLYQMNLMRKADPSVTFNYRELQPLNHRKVYLKSTN